MINAQQARKESINNFLGSLTANEKTAHFYVEAKIKEQVELGYMYLYLKWEDMPDLFDLITNLFSYNKLRDYYGAMGYSLSCDNDRRYGYLRVSW